VTHLARSRYRGDRIRPKQANFHNVLTLKPAKFLGDDVGVISLSDVHRLLDRDSIHLVNADPPYKVRVEPRSNNAIAATPPLLF
jgi:hypothetical protein